MTSCFYSVPKLVSVVSVQDFHYTNISLNYSGTHISFIAVFPGKILGESYVSVMLIFIYYRLVSLTAKENHEKLEKYSV